MIQKLKGIKLRIKKAINEMNNYKTKTKTSSSQLFMALARECQDLLLPFSETNLERAELEIMPKNHAIYIQDKPAFLPDAYTNRSTNTTRINDSLESSRSKVKFKLTPIKYIIPENQSTVFD
jgi:hypothetical protein